MSKYSDFYLDKPFVSGFPDSYEINSFSENYLKVFSFDNSQFLDEYKNIKGTTLPESEVKSIKKDRSTQTKKYSFEMDDDRKYSKENGYNINHKYMKEYGKSQPSKEKQKEQNTKKYIGKKIGREKSEGRKEKENKYEFRPEYMALIITRFFIQKSCWPWINYLIKTYGQKYNLTVEELENPSSFGNNNIKVDIRNQFFNKKLKELFIKENKNEVIEKIERVDDCFLKTQLEQSYGSLYNDCFLRGRDNDNITERRNNFSYLEDIKNKFLKKKEIYSKKLEDFAKENYESYMNKIFKKNKK